MTSFSPLDEIRSWGSGWQKRYSMSHLYLVFWLEDNRFRPTVVGLNNVDFNHYFLKIGLGLCSLSVSARMNKTNSDYYWNAIMQICGNKSLFDFAHPPVNSNNCHRRFLFACFPRTGQGLWLGNNITRMHIVPSVLTIDKTSKQAGCDCSESFTLDWKGKHEIAGALLCLNCNIPPKCKCQWNIDTVTMIEHGLKLWNIVTSNRCSCFVNCTLQKMFNTCIIIVRKQTLKDPWIPRAMTTAIVLTKPILIVNENTNNKLRCRRIDCGTLRVTIDL